MNNKPVDLQEKIEHLTDQIDHINRQLKASGNFEMKMKFIDFIDTTIEKLYNMENRRDVKKEVVQKKYEEYYRAEENQKERRNIQMEKESMSVRLKEIKEKEKQIQIQSLKIQVENYQIHKQNIIKEASTKQKELKQYIYELQKRLKGQEKEMEKLIRLNNLQTKEIDTLKEQRNRAEKNQLQWKQKYDREIGLLETFQQKNSKYMYRHEQGLKVTRTISNTTTNMKGCERYFLCDLPIKFHLVKIVYGIKIGILQPNRSIQFIDNLNLYEREEMTLDIEDKVLTLVYIKRKVTNKLDRYKVPDNKVVIMLYGKGDSVCLDENT